MKLSSRKEWFKRRLIYHPFQHLKFCVTETMLFLCIIVGMVFLVVTDFTYQKVEASSYLEVKEFKGFIELQRIPDIIKEKLPTQIHKSEYIVCHNLPADLKTQAILFYTSHQSVEIWVEDKIIYQFKTDKDLPFVKAPNSAYHIVNLNNSYAEKPITILLTSNYEHLKQEELKVYIGQPQQLIFYVISKHLPDLVISTMFFLMGTLFTILSILFSNKIKTKKPLHIGLLAVLFSVWLMLTSGVLQLIFNNKMIYMFIEYITFLLLPISMLMSIRELYELQKEKGLKLLIFIFVLNFMTSILLQVSKIKDFSELLWVSHVLIVISVLYYLVILNKKIKKRIRVKNNNNGAVRILGIAIMVSVLIDLYGYYFFLPKSHASYTRISLLVFLSYMLFSYVQEYINTSRDYCEAKVMARLAYKDVMTGLYNRTAYMKDIAEIEALLEHSPEKLQLIYVIFDLNNLKEMNDSYGHGVGDYYIVTTGQIIKKAFEKVGKCYRIGGDEFAVIVKDKTIDDYCNAIDALKMLMEHVNETNKYEFSLAFGVAVYEAGKFASLKELINKADRNMYENKSIYKENKLCDEM